MLRIRLVKGISVTGAALLIALAPLGSTAGASTASGTDPLHDNGPGFDARGDVTAFSVDDGSTITVSTSTAAFDDPETSPSWIVQLTDIVFRIDTNNDGTTDYVADYENNQAGGVDLGVWDTVGDAAHDFLCAGTASFDAAASSYSAAFPASCIGSPASVAMSVLFDYVTTTDQSHDFTAFTPATGTSATTSTTNGSPGTTTTGPETTTTNALPPETTTVSETTSTILVEAQASTSSVSSTASASTTAAPTAAAAASGTLPRTGTSTVPLILVAFCLIGAGAGLARQRRRMR